MTILLGRKGAAVPGIALAAALALVAASAVTAGPARAQTGLLTRPERTGWLETSSYQDVMGVLRELAGREGIAIDTFGYSFEGRALPVARWGGGPTRVLVFANIHAGEVEGKEAAQILLRELAGGEHAGWAGAITLWIAPIYNADGNERVSLVNRPLQLGPKGGMGQRPNAQGLDLNRDFMKLEAPETRSLVALMSEIDPHVVIDLHTTNGTYHAYHLTYAPPLHPGTDAAIDEYLRETWLPEVTRLLAPRWLTYYYGNLPDAGVTGADEPTAPRAWYSFDHRPRFGTNYVGLRNRFGILSEAYAYLPFEERIEVTNRFVETLLDFVAAHGEEIRRVAERADGESLVGKELPLRGGAALSAESFEILLGAVAEERHPYTGRRVLRRLDEVRPERMPVYGRFEATESDRVPAAYLIPADLDGILEVLAAHGIRFHPLPQSETRDVEVFAITSSSQAEREFQGHRERTLEGAWGRAARQLPAGTIVVPMDQPLARLAFALLEPRSDDGLVTWNALDAALEGAGTYPILRVHAP